MKTRLLALLLCLLLVASACLMTACGGSSKKTVDSAETEAFGEEVTDNEARQDALASFLKGISAVRKGGLEFTGTLQGNWIEDDGKEDHCDLTLVLKYNNDTFDAIASGYAGGAENGTFEAYFDGEVFGMVDNAGEGDVFFLEDVAEFIPAVAAFTADKEYSEIIDQILSLVDLDKVAANVNNSAKGVVVVRTDGKAYTVSVSSDAVFDAAAAIVNVLKDSGDMTVAELFDALLGEGSFAKLRETLEKYHGTDTLDTILPDLEAALTDLGIKVDAVYEFAAPFIGVTGEDLGAQVKATLTGMLSEMTVNDAIRMVMSMGGNKNYEEYEGYGESEPLEAAAPGEEIPDAVGAMPESGEMGMTYEAIVSTALGYSEMKVNALINMLIEMDQDEEGEEGEEGEETEPFDIAVEVAPALAYIAAFKEAIKFNVTVTCDKKLNPTKIGLTASFDSSKLPEDMIEDVASANLSLAISAEIKASVEVAPSTAMQTKITEFKTAREALPDVEEEEEE